MHAYIFYGLRLRVVALFSYALLFFLSAEISFAQNSGLLKAEPKWYISGGLGGNRGSSLWFEGSSTDGGSHCDEYINPMALELPECLGERKGSTGWRSFFDEGSGIFGSATVGYRVSDWPVQLEGEYFYRNSVYDQMSPILSQNGIAKEKLSGEVGRAQEYIYGMSSHNAFANVTFDFFRGNRFAPYVGFGAGRAKNDLANGRVWARHLDPNEITSVREDLVNAEAIRQRLAGTTSTLHTIDSDTHWGYQWLFGAEVELDDNVSLDVRGRWVQYDTFEDEGVLDQLRSHPLEGSHSNYQYFRTIQNEDMGLLGVNVNIKYSF